MFFTALSLSSSFLSLEKYTYRIHLMYTSSVLHKYLMFTHTSEEETAEYEATKCLKLCVLFFIIERETKFFVCFNLSLQYKYNHTSSVYLSKHTAVWKGKQSVDTQVCDKQVRGHVTFPLSPPCRGNDGGALRSSWRLDARRSVRHQQQ